MKFAPSLAALLASAALAAPTARDVNRAATRAAGTLDGVLRTCPTSFARVGTPGKQCVGAGGSVEAVRGKLSAVLGDDLYGVWRSRDGQRSVYNWVRTTGGYVYLRVQPDPEGRAGSLLYFDLPPESEGGAAATQAAPRVTVKPTPAPAATTPAPRPAPTPQPAQTPRPAPAATTTTPRSLAPVPFTRTLRLQAQRMNGADVRAAQDRLIALTRPSGGGRGDGWYGPVTAATVRAFQAANGLPGTGTLDRATWTRLFSEQARTFPASSIELP
ncbi:pyruvate/2-oxoglutarate dehydrogenase complex dihydrolipoamide acyltransferase (E2) component [Deinococcus sp. HSC-46F16]|uniref:peptidoglycan-binding domain-containing protein n=1 Tax=Deinococcus sp. HSC-46F16 TaxID=2910968 RepID=UPI00209D40B5|nr:peptidoglycan-binding domain-containing protein [Deinococcus sp. HSC-46F16]MCP2015364.1 pyruvate/2-oxoglutarate dehydrogenase complex dihydrolipoamide acyltransferase (E2) component [Deinococcus sp. HSC-46F16]